MFFYIFLAVQYDNLMSMQIFDLSYITVVIVDNARSSALGANLAIVSMLNHHPGRLEISDKWSKL